MKSKLFISGLAFMALATFANVQDKEMIQSQQSITVRGLAYTDVNENGICDNFEAVSKK